MATSESPIAIGVFRDHSLASQAVKELRQAGLPEEQIRQWEQSSSRGGFLESLFPHLNDERQPGGIIDSLERWGMSDDEVKYYQAEADKGHSIVIVHSPEHQEQASNILYRSGAYNARTNPRHDLHTLPIREEVLAPHTHLTEVGAVYIRKQVVSEERTITVTVQREELVVERRALDQQQTGASQTQADGGILYELAPGQTLHIPIREEQILVEKRPIVTHELIVGKRNIQETQQVSDLVRREVPYIEREGDVKVESREVEDRTPGIQGAEQPRTIPEREPARGFQQSNAPIPENQRNTPAHPVGEEPAETVQTGPATGTQRPEALLPENEPGIGTQQIDTPTFPGGPLSNTQQEAHRSQ